MARPKKALPAKLFLGLLTESPEILEEVSEALAAKYGDIDLESPTFDTANPLEEEGKTLRRRFISVEPLIDPGRLARVKQATNRVERELKPRPNRPGIAPVRIEPGYVTSANVILSCGRNEAHRVYLGRGVFAEVTLVFQDGVYQPNPWTDRDYQCVRAVDFFLQVRERYLGQIQLAE